MKIVVLDTNVFVDNVHGYAKWIDSLFNDSHYRLVVPTIVIAEYHTTEELETEGGYEKSQKYLSSFLVQDLNYEIAEELGKILRRKTYVASAGLADLIIAATSIHLDAELATRNKADFSKIPHLRFFDPKNIT